MTLELLLPRVPHSQGC